MNEQEVEKLKGILARRPRPTYTEIAREMKHTRETISYNVHLYGLLPLEER